MILINDHNTAKEQFQFSKNELIGMTFQMLKINRDHEYKQEKTASLSTLNLSTKEKREDKLQAH